MKTLRQAKKESTMREHRRVFDNMNSPQDIYLEFEGKVYVRELISGIGRFRWNKWKMLKL